MYVGLESNENDVPVTNVHWKVVSVLVYKVRPLIDILCIHELRIIFRDGVTVKPVFDVIVFTYCQLL